MLVRRKKVLDAELPDKSDEENFDVKRQDGLFNVEFSHDGMLPVSHFLIIKLKQVKYYGASGSISQEVINQKKNSTIEEHRIKDIRSLISLVQLNDANPKGVVAIKQKLLYQREGMMEGEETDQQQSLSKKTLTIKGKDGSEKVRF